MWRVLQETLLVFERKRAGVMYREVFYMSTGMLRIHVHREE